MPTPALLALAEAEAERRRRATARAAEAAEREAATRAARASLAAFVRAAWEVVEPGRPLVWGWHLDALCRHLEAVTAGDLLNLLIAVPPGCTKSRLVGVFWPAWVWLREPAARWLFVSNAEELATRESLACRRLVESDWYARLGPAVRLTTDQNVKTWYENDRGGHRQAVGVRANVTGKKAEYIVVDDANDAEKVQGEADRRAVNDKWDNAIYDRVTDFKTGRRVVVGQRTHIDDLIGHIKATAPEFAELRIPEEFEPARRCSTPIGWADPRTAEGELLRPGQFGPEQAAAAKGRLGTIGYRAKHQQDPQTREGYRFKATWLAHRWHREGDHYVLRPADGRPEYRFVAKQARHRFGTADGAASAKTGADFTVLSGWVVSPRNDLLWVGCRRERLEIPDQPAALRAEYDRHGWEFVGVEAVLANVALYQHASRTTMVIKRLDPEGKDKLARATPAMIFAEAGRLYLPAAGAAAGYPWGEVEAELLAFTGDEKQDAHDDTADTLAYAVKLLNGQLGSGTAQMPKGVGGLPNAPRQSAGFAPARPGGR